MAIDKYEFVEGRVSLTKPWARWWDTWFDRKYPKMHFSDGTKATVVKCFAKMRASVLLRQSPRKGPYPILWDRGIIFPKQSCIDEAERDMEFFRRNMTSPKKLITVHRRALEGSCSYTWADAT